MSCISYHCTFGIYISEYIIATHICDCDDCKVLIWFERNDSIFRRKTERVTRILVSYTTSNVSCLTDSYKPVIKCLILQLGSMKHFLEGEDRSFCELVDISSWFFPPIGAQCIAPQATVSSSSKASRGIWWNF